MTSQKIKSLFFAIVFFACFALTFLAITDSLYAWHSLLLGIVLLGAVTFLPKNKWISLGVLLVWVILLVIFWNELITGLKIMCNGLFANSEQNQAYRYHYFSIEVVRKLYPTYVTASAYFCTVPCSLLFCLLQKDKSGIAYMALFGSQAVFCTVFGVFANAVFAVTFLFVLLFFFLPDSVWQNKKMLLPFALVFLGCAVLFFICFASYQKIDVLSQWTETFRDNFDKRVEGFIGNLNAFLSSSQGNGGGSGGQSGSGSEMATTVQRVPILLIVISVLAVVALLVPVLFFVKGKKSLSQLKKDVTSSDCAKAIRAYFLLSVHLLQKKGLRLQNKGYRGYIVDVENLFGSSYAKTYAESVSYYEESVYSSHTLSLQKREDVKSFYQNTKRLKRSRK